MVIHSFFNWGLLILLIVAVGIILFLGSRFFAKVAVRAPRTFRWTRFVLSVAVVVAVVGYFSAQLPIMLPSSERQPSSGQAITVVDRGAPPPKKLEMSPPRSSDETVKHSSAPFVYRVPDSFEDWKKSLVDFDDFETLARSRGVPDWVLNAGGSDYERLEVPGKLFVETRTPGESKSLVGYGMLGLNREDAETRALRAATEQIVAAVLWRLRDSTGNLHDVAELAREIVFERQEALSHGIFTEPFRLPISGELYWSAVRFDSDESTLEGLAQSVKKALDSGRLEQIHARRAFVAKLFSAFGLALCAFLIYCFLNAGTKGHFAWPLRIISFGGLVVILVLAFIA